MEIWDAYDNCFNKIVGVTLIRGNTIPQGYYHLVCDIIVRHVDGTYLLMQRDFKKNLGGLWEATAGGSALSGETPIECAKRELFEETGIKDGDLVEIGRTIHHSRQSIYFEYLCIVNIDKNTILLQEGETISFKWISKDELKSLTNDVLASKRILSFVNELNH